MLSDFTEATSIGVTLAGQPLAHWLYRFRLAISGWQDFHFGSRGELRRPSQGAQDAL